MPRSQDSWSVAELTATCPHGLVSIICAHCENDRLRALLSDARFMLSATADYLGGVHFHPNTLPELRMNPEVLNRYDLLVKAIDAAIGPPVEEDK